MKRYIRSDSLNGDVNIQNYLNEVEAAISAMNDSLSRFAQRFESDIDTLKAIKDRFDYNVDELIYLDDKYNIPNPDDIQGSDRLSDSEYDAMFAAYDKYANLVSDCDYIAKYLRESVGYIEKIIDRKPVDFD